MFFRRCLLVTAIALGIVAYLDAGLTSEAQAQTRTERSSRPARPPLPAHAHERPRARPGYTWLEGRWIWDWRQAQYVWLPGHWERDNARSRRGDPRLVFRGGRWQFEPGR